jgi:hypothetical protein
MQVVKDSFFIALRDRLANSETGGDAPRLIACENDRCAWLAEADTFYLRWKGEVELPVDAQRAGWRALQCEIGYRTLGTEVCSGEDRGRKLSALDAQLLAAAAARKSELLDCEEDLPTALGAVILWTGPALKSAEDKLNGLQRLAQLSVLWRDEEVQA